METNENTRVLLILKGIPASSKSTYAKKLMKEEPNWVRINKDSIREMLHNSEFSHRNEKLVRDAQKMLILAAFAHDFNVILDNTHIGANVLQGLHDDMKRRGNVKVIEKGFKITLEEAKHRNALREGVARVPDHVIEKMFADSEGTDILEASEVFYP